MAQSINLIPQEERLEQTKTMVVKVSTYISVLILIVVGGVSAYFYFQTANLKQKIASYDNEISEYRSRINGFSTMEIKVRNLSKKSQALQTLFDNRKYYSVLLDNLNKSSPPGIIVESFSLDAGTNIAVSGFADTYNDVQEFANMLLEREIFKEVSLKSVGLEGNRDKITFFIVVNYDEAMLNE